jgi:hypothetical protein
MKKYRVLLQTSEFDLEADGYNVYPSGAISFFVSEFEPIYSFSADKWRQIKRLDEGKHG